MLNLSNKLFSGHSGKIAGIAVSPDGSKAVSGAYASQSFDRDAIIWELPSGKLERHLRGHRVGIFSVAYSPDGWTIATGGGAAVTGSEWVHDHAIRLWSHDGTELRRFGEDLFCVHALAFSADGRFLLSGSGNHARMAPVADGACFRLWEVSTGREVRRFGHHPSAVNTVQFSPDGKCVVSGSNGMRADGSVAGRMRHEQSFRVIVGKLNPSKSRSVSVEQDERSPAAEDQTIRIWETNSGCELNLFSHQGWVNSLAFSPDGKRLLSAGKGVILWNATSGERVCQIGGKETNFAHCATFSPDGSHVAVGTGGQLETGSPYENCCTRLYDLTTGRESARWNHKYAVAALAFSHDGAFILAGGERGELHLWRVA